MPDSTELMVASLQDWIELFVRRSMRNTILYAKQHNMSMSQVGALFQIRRKGVCSVSDIGEDLGVTSAAASQLLDRLVEQGLVGRTEDPSDRRAKQLVLTEKGCRVVQQSIDARQSWFGVLARNLTPAEQAEVTAALGLLIEKAHLLDKASSQ